MCPINSKNKEVAVLVRIVMNDVSTINGSNCLNLKIETEESPLSSTPRYIREILTRKVYIPGEYILSCWLFEKYIFIHVEILLTMLFATMLYC